MITPSYEQTKGHPRYGESESRTKFASQSL